MRGDSQREPGFRTPPPSRHSRGGRPARPATPQAAQDPKAPQATRVNPDLDLDELDPDGRARRAATKKAGRRAAPPTRRRKALRYAGLTMAGVLLATTGAGAYLYVHFNSNLKSTALLPSGVTQAAEIPDQFGRTAMNILLLGNAGRIDAADCALGGACDDTATSADSIMVLHLSADRSNMTVMSIPRDSIVNLPSCAHDSEDLINAALVSGPSCAVEAVHNLTGLTIDHFIEIDMAGVVTMSNALGGVPVCVTNNIYDPSTRADSAAAVAQALGIPSTAMHESGDYSEVTVVIGGDWTSGTAFSSAATATGTGAAAPTGVASSAPASSLETNAADGNACMYVPQPEW